MSGDRMPADTALASQGQRLAVSYSEAWVGHGIFQEDPLGSVKLGCSCPLWITTGRSLYTPLRASLRKSLLNANDSPQNSTGFLVYRRFTYCDSAYCGLRQFATRLLLLQEHKVSDLLEEIERSDARCSKFQYLGRLCCAIRDYEDLLLWRTRWYYGPPKDDVGVLRGESYSLLPTDVPIKGVEQFPQLIRARWLSRFLPTDSETPITRGCCVNFTGID